MHLLLDMPSDPFEIVSNMGVGTGSSDSAKAFVAGFYDIMIVICVVGVVCTLLISAASYFSSNNSQKRYEFKEELKGKLIILLLAFGGTGILNVLLKIGRVFV